MSRREKSRDIGQLLPYSRKYWRELNLAVEPKIAIGLFHLIGSSGSRQVSIVSVETPFGRLEIQAHYGVALIFRE